jgi:hypothetical protein
MQKLLQPVSELAVFAALLGGGYYLYQWNEQSKARAEAEAARKSAEAERLRREQWELQAREAANLERERIQAAERKRVLELEAQIATERRKQAEAEALAAKKTSEELQVLEQARKEESKQWQTDARRATLLQRKSELEAQLAAEAKQRQVLEGNVRIYRNRLETAENQKAEAREILFRYLQTYGLQKWNGDPVAVQRCLDRPLAASDLNVSVRNPDNSDALRKTLAVYISSMKEVASLSANLAKAQAAVAAKSKTSGELDQVGKELEVLGGAASGK